MQSSLAEDPKLFDAQITVALRGWKEEGRKAIWITIPSNLSPLIPVAAAHGFEVSPLCSF